jgi:hypothetical protein
MQSTGNRGGQGSPVDTKGPTRSEQTVPTAPQAAIASRAALWRPLYRPNALRWSEDNLLAVAAGDTVAILSAADLRGGPRGAAVLSHAPALFSAEWSVGGSPPHFQRHVGFRLDQSLSSYSQPLLRQSLLDLAWAPPLLGAPPVKRIPTSLLAVCTSSFRVILPPSPLFVSFPCLSAPLSNAPSSLSHGCVGAVVSVRPG